MKKEEFYLNNDNYFSPEANKAYLDCTTYKGLVGTSGMRSCECKALAIANGKYTRPKSEALLVGSYVDAYFDGTLDKFKRENINDLYAKASIKKYNEGKIEFGELELLKAYTQADVMIARAIKEPLFMKYVEGETQKILTADIEGVPIRVKLDSYDGHRITDIKTASSISQTWYVADLGQRLNFAEYFGYVEQAFFYQTAVEQYFGKHLPFYLAVITKEKVDTVPHPRVAIIQIPDAVIEEKGKTIKQNIHKAWALLQGEIQPVPCGCCEWCADNLPLEEVISLDELILEV